MMKKLVFNMIFYSVCFYFIHQIVWELAFTAPPAAGSPAYKAFCLRTSAVSICIGVMIVVPNLALECLKKDWFK